MKSQSKAIPIASNMASAAFVAILLVLVVASSSSEAAITSCNPVATHLSPCRTYLQTGNGRPSTDCCDGARALLKEAPSTADKQKACTCMKGFARRLRINPSAAKAMPGLCQINFPYTISANTDCSKVK